MPGTTRVRHRAGREISTAGLLGLLIVACSTEPAPSPRPSEIQLARGQELYVAHCQECHGNQAAEGGIPAAPPHNAEGHTWHHPDAQLTDWILNGKPFTAMPAFGDRLNETDANRILTYIKTWWTDEQRAEQSEVSERYQEALDAQNESP